MFKLTWEGKDVEVRFVKRATWLRPRETRVLITAIDPQMSCSTGWSGGAVRRPSEPHSDYLAELYALLDAKKRAEFGTYDVRTFWQAVFDGWHQWRERRRVQGLMPAVRGKEIIHGVE